MTALLAVTLVDYYASLVAVGMALYVAGLATGAVLFRRKPTL